MSTAVRQLQPASLWNHFADLNAVPRASKKEERIIAFVKSFAESLQLPFVEDVCGNVIVRKPATKGMEDRATVVLQSHLDMVHQKNGDTVFDFDNEGIRMKVDGAWVRAEGTTLGADNGIGVAAIMALLSSTDIPHPPLEALFTIDEETGMTGALGLKGGLLHGKFMLNLDTEDDQELTIGCAGGVDITALSAFAMEPAGSGVSSFSLSVKGLTGGHSGMDIHLGRGNANKIMNRILWQLSQRFGVRIHSIDGGSLRNAIPRESVACCVVPSANEEALGQFVHALSSELLEEYRTTDPGLSIALGACHNITTVIGGAFQAKLLRAIYACPNGIYRMSPDIKDLVQTSNNLARVEVKEGKATIMCLCRSSVESEKMDEAEMIRSVFEQIGAQVDFGGSYPGWTPRPEATIVQLMRSIYTSMFGHEPHVNACHAGLECGILGRNYTGMEMISFGPNIRGAHSPDERVEIASVQKFWNYLLETLKRIPQA